ncbi:MAG: hypothetical protein MUF81_03870 [Verrucomicrobia bacterium]|jgi:hypothetical protein|nr:hypothetical protein [Verrucomicrobiota bacterium]
MSLKQLAANRRNAQKSTGPKTPAGKTVSRMNAMKHGLLARQVVVRGLKLRESSHEFKTLCRDYYEHLMPVGPLEEMLVGQIVTTQWRLRRARTAESGEIALSVDDGCWERAHPNLARQWANGLMFGDPLSSMRDSLMGNMFLELPLKEVRAAVARDGELTEAAIQGVLASFAGKPNMLTRKLTAFRAQLARDPDGLDTSARRAKHQQQVLDYLDNELRQLRWRKSTCQEREDKQDEARQAAAVLPPMEVLDKILRYETALERQLFRAMNQLERLQRRRQGENVPPPVTMEISARA